jgi:hypothetical protein
MFIQCTKKFLEQLDIKPESRVEEEPLFSWHAHLISVNRRKTVVLVNDKNRYAIVLYGLKSKDCKRFNEIVLQGIRETFEEEGIKEEVIEKFLLHSKEFTYSKAKDRTSVARMNKVCANVYFYEDLLDNNLIINTKISRRVSRCLVGNGKNDYIRPNEEMYKELEDFVGQHIFRMKAVQIKVVLKLGERQVWRRIVVPVTRTFPELHDILQSAFGWRNCHLHEFVIFENKPSGHDITINDSSDHEKEYNPIMNLVCDEEAFAYPKETEMKPETGIKLSEYIPTYKKLKYNYDFGDDWQHDIEVERIIDDYNANYPICLEGEGNTPPEDVGGSYGYEEFLAILADPKHLDYKHMVNWGNVQGYEEFDIVRVNRILKNR